MNEKIDVLGVEIDNVKAEAAMEKTVRFLNTESLSTIAVLSVGMLLKAGEDPEYKRLLEQTDLSIIEDKKILEAAGILQKERYKEVEENRYLMRFFDYLDQNKKALVLLCESAEEQNALESFFEKNFPGLIVAGAFALENLVENTDSLINDINGVTAEVILSTLKTPVQEEFIAENRAKLNARIWIGTGKNLKTSGVVELKTGFLGKMIENRIFKKKIIEYQQEKGDS